VMRKLIGFKNVSVVSVVNCTFVAFKLLRQLYLLQ